MKTTSVLQLLLILTIFVSTSTQAQNPDCQPIEAKKEYDKTLFVFLVETSGFQDELIKYVMKQIACTIPETKNIKSYILDYTDETALVTVKEDDFSTSQQFVGKIANSLKAPFNILQINCFRLPIVQKFFSEQDAVKKYEEHVKYIIFMKTCHPTGLPDGWFLFNVFVVNNVVWYERDSKHAVALQPSESDAPQLLKDASKKIVGTILEDDSLWQTPAPSSSNNNDSDNDILLYIIIAILIVIIIILVIYVIFTCRKRKSTNLKTDGEKKENTAKGTERDSNKNDAKGKEKDVSKNENTPNSETQVTKNEKSAENKSTLSYSITLESEADKKKRRK